MSRSWEILENETEENLHISLAGYKTQLQKDVDNPKGIASEVGKNVFADRIGIWNKSIAEIEQELLIRSGNLDAVEARRLEWRYDRNWTAIKKSLAVLFLPLGGCVFVMGLLTLGQEKSFWDPGVGLFGSFLEMGLGGFLCERALKWWKRPFPRKPLLKSLIAK